MEFSKNARKDCAYLRIASELRGAIESGEFPAGCRMPTVGDLAKRFSTSVFTIQSALKPLEREGLIEQKRKVGIFVRNAKARLETLGDYYGRDIRTMEELVFCRRFQAELERRLKETGIKSELFIDARLPEESGLPYKLLIDAIEHGEIQALAALELSYDRAAWVAKLQIPKAMFTTRLYGAQVYFDTEAFIDSALSAFKATGRRRPAVICNIPSLRESWPEHCAKAGLEAKAAWMRVSSDPNITGRLQSFGYESFLSLWEERTRPDALFIFPDTVARGAMTGILSKGVKVPGELFVAMHRNEGIDMPCPFPALVGLADAKLAVKGVLEQISKAMRGEPQAPLRLSHKIVEQS